VLDMRLTEDLPLEGLKERIQNAVPSALQIIKVESVDESLPAMQTLVVQAEYEVAFTEPIEGSDLKRRVDSLLEAACLPRERRGKAYDLRPLIEQVSLLDNPLRLWMLLSAREGATGRPEEVLEQIGIPADTVRVERTRLIFVN